jgi:hypothetical protein
LRQRYGVERPSERVPKEVQLAATLYRAYRTGQGSMARVGRDNGADAAMVHRVVHHPKFAEVRAAVDAELAPSP